ncbi:MAG: thioredoxin domain-containing protein [Rhodobiaceae bacterium]|nr:thioredoxin domain-containing protein [Rhodobiaceae bacterium]
MSHNLLGQETSPYLLQHRDNPVHWRPWGPDALAEARRSGKPILLSIGYAACHWCHVMAHESFEDAEVAAAMNAHFVNIKVDREERPDIDSIYMTALQLLGEPGGWPLTMFLTPDGDPFWGGTYFPKTASFGRPGFIQVLEEVAHVFANAPDRIEHNRKALADRLKAPRADQGGEALTAAFVDSLATPLLEITDFTHGGMMGAPKFPQVPFLELLWRLFERGADARCRSGVLTTLDHMCMGGIYDHLGGGFSRYSVDALWLVPHFEKMLYDNALLLDFLTTVWRATGSPLYAARCGETIGWLEREMLTGHGAFAASLDADSQGEEGLFYVWSADELRALLGADDFAFFAACYGVRDGGNWEGKTILNRLHEIAPRSAGDETRLARLRAHLLDQRENRPRPGLDDKILADWNGLVIHALADAGFAFARPDWLAMAQRAFDFVAESMVENGRLCHSIRAGRQRGKGLLADYAAMTRAALALYERTGNAGALDHARAWSKVLEDHFAHPAGGYYMTPDDADDLILRPYFATDDAIPNANGLAAQNLVRLWHLTGETAYRQRADRIFAAFAADMRRNPLAFCALINAFDLALRGRLAVHVAPPTTSPQPDAGPLAKLLSAASPLSLIVNFVSQDGALPPGHPAHGKTAGTDGPAVYLCAAGRCSLPVTEAQDLAAALADPKAHADPPEDTAN